MIVIFKLILLLLFSTFFAVKAAFSFEEEERESTVGTSSGDDSDSGIDLNLFLTGFFESILENETRGGFVYENSFAFAESFSIPTASISKSAGDGDKTSSGTLVVASPIPDQITSTDAIPFADIRSEPNCVRFRATCVSNFPNPATDHDLGSLNWSSSHGVLDSPRQSKIRTIKRIVLVLVLYCILRAIYLDI